MVWYEPNKAALTVAFPLLRKNAILIIDDYGHHTDVMDATNEFLENIKTSFDLTMADCSCSRIIF
jgi:hypothetical protein